MCICNYLHVDLSPISFRFVTIYMQICCHLHVYLSLVSFRVVMIFLCICYNPCVYLSLVSLIFVPMFIWICEEMQMYMIHICHNIFVVLSKAAHEYKLVYQLIWIFAQNLCRASLKGWPNNHERGCILEKLLVRLPEFPKLSGAQRTVTEAFNRTGHTGSQNCIGSSF